ncbi:MAG: hypothetical protein MSH16_02510 [Oscillospiraceae bacterium]|nr:hypothetical protein [Oscillospiraceae bacterium]MDD6502105.1 hypothetical protein [Oscillospiraceae bacterium]MDY4106011.1 hypothetical protein [Oscillospiraceae bacterium]
MSEWTVVTVLVALLGLFATVAKPIVSLNATIARLGETVERLDAKLTELTEHNADSHRRLWEECDRHGQRIEDHETRLTVLEQQ